MKSETIDIFNVNHSVAPTVDLTKRTSFINVPYNHEIYVLTVNRFNNQFYHLWHTRWEYVHTPKKVWYIPESDYLVNIEIFSK